MNNITPFDIGDIVRYNDPDYGEGSGVVAGIDVDRDEVYVYPKRKIYQKEFLVCKPETLILTPF